MSKWYDIQAKAGERPKVYLYDEIGNRGITAQEFAAEFNAIDASHIDLHIESFGGSVTQGTAIKNTIRQHKAHVTAYIDSMAGSISSAIALACDEVRIAEDAYVMIHKPYKRSEGDADELRKEADVLDKMAEAMAKEYAAKMGISVSEAHALMAAETWYVGQEAVDAGYADSTYAGTHAVASFDPGRFSNKAPKAAVERFTKSPPRGKSHPSATVKEQSMSDETNATETDDESVDTQDTDITSTTVEGDGTTEPAATNEPTAASTVDVEARVQEALARDRRRCADIRALGNKFGFTDAADQFSEGGKSVEEFRAHILNKSPEDWKASLAVKNPAQQDTGSNDDEGDEEAAEAVAKIKERRKARS